MSTDARAATEETQQRTPGRVICVMARPLDQDDGIGVYTWNLLSNLLKLDPSSHYILLLRTARHADDFAAFPNAEVRVVSAPTKLWWDQVVVPRIARQVDADLVFNPKFSLPLVSGVPGVFVLHGSDWFVNPGNYPWWDNLYIRVMLPLYCRKAAALLSISNLAIEDTARYTGLNLEAAVPSYAAPGEHFRVVEDPGLLERFRETHGLPERFILTVARAYHTGHGKTREYPGGNNESLVRGYRRYRAAGGSLPLVVVGRDIEAYLRRHNFGEDELENVTFTGFIPNTEIVCAYNLADFFVLCTMYESFPLPVAEALASGCPALLPTTGGCRDLAGPAASYVEPLDVEAIGRAMLEMERHPDQRERLRAAGLERVKEFTWRRTAERTLEAFDRVVARAG